MDFEKLQAIYPCINKDSHIDINKEIACKDINDKTPWNKYLQVMSSLLNMMVVTDRSLWVLSRNDDKLMSRKSYGFRNNK